MTRTELSDGASARRWTSRFLLALVILAPLTVVGAMLMVKYEITPLPFMRLLPQALIYSGVFSAIYASAPTWRRRTLNGE